MNMNDENGSTDGFAQLKKNKSDNPWAALRGTSGAGFSLFSTDDFESLDDLAAVDGGVGAAVDLETAMTQGKLKLQKAVT